MSIGAPSDFNLINPATTKGDLIVRTATSATRLAVGANNTVLTADSAQASGTKWATPLTVAGITATAAEIDLQAAVAAQTETVSAAGAISVTKRITKLTSAAPYTATLAAPSAAMYGMIKIIEMTVDGGDITLALTNVQGQASGTTATFNDVNDTLVLVGGTNKWTVLSSAGITLA